MEKRKRAVILVRRSLAEDKNESNSLEIQKNMCLKKAEELDYDVIEEILEENSAYNLPIDKRPELQRILNMATENEIDAVICWQKSRLVRDMSDEIIVASVFRECDIEVIFVDPKELPMGKGEGDVESLLSIITTWRDQAEVFKLRSRIKDHLRGKASVGSYVGGSFTGYKWNMYLKKMEQVPGEIDIVKKIFTLYLYDGLSTNQIANYLNRQGYRTRKGKLFYAYSVISILQSKIYCGYYRWGFTTSKRRTAPVPSEGFEHKVEWVDPIITLEEWMRVQEIMISRSGKKRGQKNRIIPKSSFLLSGKVYCGVCEGKMYARNGSTSYKKKDGTEGKTEHFRYICSSHLPHPVPKRYDSRKIDHFVFEGLCKEIQSLDKDRIFEYAQNELRIALQDLLAEKNGYERKIEQIQNAITNLWSIAEKTADKEISELYGNRIKNNYRDIEVLGNKINEIEEKLKRTNLSITDLQESFEYLTKVNEESDLSQEKKRMYVEDLVDKVIILWPEIKVKMKWYLKDRFSLEEIAQMNFEYTISMN